MEDLVQLEKEAPKSASRRLALGQEAHHHLAAGRRGGYPPPPPPPPPPLVMTDMRVMMRHVRTDEEKSRTPNSSQQDPETNQQGFYLPDSKRKGEKEREREREREREPMLLFHTPGVPPETISPTLSGRRGLELDLLAAWVPKWYLFTHQDRPQRQ